jgi:prepilin-type N-terminal cleavage/methylation domain-containing protein
LRSAKRSIHRSRGFTLIELAMVIAIGALLLGWGLSVLTAQLTNARIKATQNQATVIKKALITFLSTNNRLPCPAVENLPDSNANYGIEAPNPGTCTGTTNLTGASRGVVPWVSLGLADSAALDGWNRRYTYVVTTSETGLVAEAVQQPGQRTVSAMTGNATVHNATPIGLGLPGVAGQNQINACTTTPADNSCNNFAVVVVISHGANGFGAFLPGTGARLLPLPVGANELENTNADTAFTQMAFSDNPAAPGGVFDDLIFWLPPADLTTPLQESGTITTADVLLNRRLARIENAILGYAIVDRVDPDGPPTGPTSPCDCGVDCTGPIPPDTAPSGWVGCRTAYHRVPLADKLPGDGFEDRIPLPTTTGAVPWQTLGLTARDILDPWGTRLEYVTFDNVSGSILAPAPTYDDGINSLWVVDPNAYQLRSFGPDTAVGGGDDVTVLKPTSEMIAEMARASIPVD